MFISKWPPMLLFLGEASEYLLQGSLSQAVILNFKLFVGLYALHHLKHGGPGYVHFGKGKRQLSYSGVQDYI